MNFEQTPEFAKDLKRLSKKWRSLPSDIEYVKPRIESLYTPREDIDLEQYRSDFFGGKGATILQSAEGYEVVKMRLDVAALSTNNKVRLVFVAVVTENKVVFIELYAKSEKDREDAKRINRAVGILW